MNDKPGVMIYFELKETLNRLSDADAGILFRAIMEYGATGREAELSDALLVLWPLIRMRLDIDDQRYRNTSYKRKYAVYVRWAKHHNQEVMAYDDWLASVAQYEYQEEMGFPS